MNLSGNDYTGLYQLQDKFLTWWLTLRMPFYLTGGTALGRFYLHHRYSEDLDFFINADPAFFGYIAILKQKLGGYFTLDPDQSLFTNDFARFYITDNQIRLKIEFVNDVGYYAGNTFDYRFGKLDCPLNIIANKLSAVVGRDEPKDVFDIIHMALNYSFFWPDIFHHAKQKCVINELDFAQRLDSFNVQWLDNVKWTDNPVQGSLIRKWLDCITDDFLLGNHNTLGKHCQSIETAQPAG
ncbi:MAG: hypothetical protein A2X11_09340 [Bacteroidetes bacterium GWE2_42_24]|nr:MAG: hypothetical protein A2X11_09340 [Bacteroidetes bacterium GWE2_42_24]HCT86510.1 hypothetical protein [Candidatus Margulisiibacteriota bacterium]